MLTRQSLSAMPRVRLTLIQARKNLLWCAVNILWECTFGLYRLHQHAYFIASLMLLLAMIQLIYIPINWKLYQRLRRGENVFIAVAKPVQVSRIWSVVVALLLTAVVGAETFMCWAILQAGRTNWIVWLIMAVVNLLLWAFVIYVWMRVMSQSPSTAIYDAVNGEPQEGVWPPPPRLPDDERESE